MKKNVVIIGFGGMGGWHAKHIMNNDVVNLLGVYDIKPERAEVAAERGVHFFGDAGEAIEGSAADFIVIATPNDSHKELAIRAMAAGKHVVSEKPVTLCSADLAQMIAASKKYGKIFTVHQNRRWDADFLLMKQIYNSGELGEVTKIESRYHGSRGIPGDWRGKPEFGGGMMLDWGVHLIDQILQIIKDDIKKIYCRCDYITNSTVDDGFTLDLMFREAGAARIEVGTSNFISMPRFYMTGTNGGAMIRGWKDPAQVVCCKNWDEKDVVPVVTAAGLTKTMAPRDAKTVTSYELEQSKSDVHDFYRNICAAIDGTAEQLVKHEEVARVMRVMEAAFESSKLNQVVDFE